MEHISDLTTIFRNANRLGADIVIHSVHKTLPALTQTALLHMNGTLADRKRVRHYLHMLQSSSPSYVLMAGIDACVHLLETRAQEFLRSMWTIWGCSEKVLKGWNICAYVSQSKYEVMTDRRL